MTAKKGQPEQIPELEEDDVEVYENLDEVCASATREKYSKNERVENEYI